MIARNEGTTKRGCAYVEFVNDKRRIPTFVAQQGVDTDLWYVFEIPRGNKKPVVTRGAGLCRESAIAIANTLSGGWEWSR